MRGLVARCAPGAVFVLLAGAAFAEPVELPGVDHGREVAERDCGMCHAVAPQGRSPNAAAPAFRDLAVRYNPIALERKLRTIGKQGHFEMRPPPVSEADVPDLAAYIGTLARR